MLYLFCLLISILIRYIFTFAGMNERKQATIRALFINGYTDSLRRVRKSHKGLKQPYIKPVMIIGEYAEGITCIAAAEICNSSRSAMYQLLFRAIKGGYIYKSNKVYYLTDAGRNVYASMCKEFDTSMKTIIAALVEEAKKHL